MDAGQPARDPGTGAVHLQRAPTTTSADMNDLLSIYAERHRGALLIAAALLIVAIAGADYATVPYFSLGFLYLIPIVIAGGFLRRWQTVALAMVCGVLQEVFSNLPRNDWIVRLIVSSVGFSAAGLLVSELIRNRQIALRHLSELEAKERLRKDAEEELKSLVNTSPAAIVTIDANGTIVIANDAAHRLLGAPTNGLRGQTISTFLPSLLTAVRTPSSKGLRTTMQCRGHRVDGDAFLAGVWFSTYRTLDGPRLAAIVVDVSEDLRSREDLSLEHLLKSARILMSAVAHEIRNLCDAALVVHQNLSQVAGLQENEDFHALRTLIQSLESVMSLQLQASPAARATPVELTSVFDEVRVLLQASFEESEIEIDWQVPESLPLVLADRYGLVQVFLNLAKNSQRAMQASAVKRLRVSAEATARAVTVRFEDTGTGVKSPERLFQPFQADAVSTGLGLYVSRAIVRSFGGDLAHESRPQGACFAIVLEIAPAEAEWLSAQSRFVSS
jgi:PAS domain S-box-containing protein